MVVIFLSKYFSKAKENKKSEKIEINIDGINVNKAKKVLKWNPKLNISKSIELTVEWYKSVLNNKKNCRNIKKKDIFLCDSGGQYKYGTTDVTRTICFSKPKSYIKNII